MMSRQLSWCGNDGGRRRASTTAVVKLSIVTCAMFGDPNFECTIPPCSVTLRPPCTPPRPTGCVHAGSMQKRICGPRLQRKVTGIISPMHMQCSLTVWVPM